MAVDLPDLKPKSLAEYKQAIKALRRFATGFDAGDKYDLRSFRKLSDITPARRKRIKEYWQTVRNAETQGVLMETVRPRRKDKLKALQEYSNVDYQKGFKVAFIQKRKDEKIVFKKVKGKPVVSGVRSTITGIIHKEVPFNKQELIKNTSKYLDEFINEHMIKNDFAIVINGEHFMYGSPVNKGGVKNKITKLMNEYGADKKNNYFMNWLDGIKITSGPSMREIDNYVGDRAVEFTKQQEIRRKKYQTAKKRRWREKQKDKQVIKQARAKAAKIRKAKGL